MWTLGRLTDQVKEKILELIEMEDKEERWEAEKERKSRLQVLEDLKRKLLSEMPLRKEIPTYKPFITLWKPGEVYVYQVKSPPIDEVFNPSKNYKNYIGWYITLYVHEIVDMNINLPGVPDEIPCLYLMFTERKPTSIDKLRELKVIYEELSSRDDRKRLKNCRWLLIQGALRKYPKDLEFLGVCKDFNYPVDEYIESDNVNFIWWNTIELYAIRSYEIAIKRLREGDK